ncbi:hypothetical protein [Amycolatopsis japonica]
MSDNNFRQELVSPETGNTIVVGTPSEAARLRSEGWTEPVKKPAPKPAGKPADVSKPAPGTDVKTDK